MCATGIGAVGPSGAQVIDSLFRSFDIDGDGHITYEELSTILRYEARRSVEAEEEDEEDEKED